LGNYPRNKVDSGDSRSEGAARGCQHGSHGAAFDDPAVLNDDHPVGDGEGVEQVV